MSRTVIHIDMDAYFASIEQRDVPLYRKKPLLVCHTDDLSSYRGVVAAASYEAREFGIRAGTSVLEAKIKLPNAIYVAGNYEKYLYNTRRLVEICERYSDIVEVYSIDEAFLDMTSTTHLFGSARDAAAALQKEVQEKLNLTCSIGVGPNKLVAKMASEFNKPGGLSVVDRKDLPGLLAPLPIESIPGIGRRMSKHLDAIGIKTIGHLAEARPEVLKKKFGIIGEVLSRAARGIDDSPVISTREGVDVKSFGQSLSLGKGSTDTDYLYNVLLGLCDGATRRMRKAGYLGRTVTVYIIMGRLFSLSRRTSLGGYTDLPGRVFGSARRILSSLLAERAAFDIYPVTKVGVSVADLTKKGFGQQISVFDILDKKEAALTSTVDRLKNKYGERAVTRCSLLGLRSKYLGAPRAEIGIF
ncbi:MAG: DNA polymerase IV [Firmicutes bacterium]|nr:DNA polymerase IV [Bacillota bacterium]